MDDYVNGDGTKPRFKIDTNKGSMFFPVALFVRGRLPLINNWWKLQTFETVEKATEFYDTIKDLPKYLR